MPSGEQPRIVCPLRDGFRESIIRLRVKIDNGLEKPNQGLKKEEKKEIPIKPPCALHAHNDARRT